MRICVPIIEDSGIASKASEHFGSAPFFFVYDTDTNSQEVVANTNQHHGHGMCHPLSVLARHKLNAVVCRGMGGGAIAKMNVAGIKVYTGSATTAKEAIDAFVANQLSELTPDNACAHQGCH